METFNNCIYRSVDRKLIISTHKCLILTLNLKKRTLTWYKLHSKKKKISKLKIDIYEYSNQLFGDKQENLTNLVRFYNFMNTQLKKEKELKELFDCIRNEIERLKELLK